MKSETRKIPEFTVFRNQTCYSCKGIGWKRGKHCDVCNCRGYLQSEVSLKQALYSIGILNSKGELNIKGENNE